MSWIKTIGVEAATGKLKKIYQKVAGPGKNVDNILLVHSLRPHTLEGHMALYKNVLHHSANQLPKHQLEAIGIYVSSLNNCSYCVEHHCTGYKRLIKDSEQAEKVCQAICTDQIEEVFNSQEITLFDYAKKLTLAPSTVTEGDLATIRDAGFDDGAILEINQVIGYFNYANRTVLGLGISIEGDVLGGSPGDSDNPENWEHS